ncbi:hypothetical protein GTN31_08575 [Macrococcoides canis]|uniref:hypothetical protein n=1 Tax=Macrococcoides canis TaxID=1855823 RepID=UPI0013E986AE|nr:hypothetical protein [Macrococcus canis]QIH76417.1 hypothetical protein GTN31_08575 [Macrococcus canis]
MPNYLEIIRLHELSFSQRKICESVGLGRTLVKRVNSGLKMLFFGGLKMSFFSDLRLSHI